MAIKSRRNTITNKSFLKKEVARMSQEGILGLVNLPGGPSIGDYFRPPHKDHDH